MVADTDSSLQADDAIGHHIWSLFYHMLIPQSSLETLREHAAKLLKASESLETWLASSYGKFIRFINRATLFGLRGYWHHYRSFDVSELVTTAFKNRLSQCRRESRKPESLALVRSAGPLWRYSLDMTPRLHHWYWETGLASGVSGHWDESSDGEERLLPNPMFAVSFAPSGEFAVHYWTEPLCGFHLTETFRSWCSSEAIPTQQEKSQRLVQAAKDQFRGWCNAFMIFVQTQRIRIQFFSGDALALCHELQFELEVGKEAGCARTSTRQWRLHPLRLDGFVGHQSDRRSFLDYFDVIDASNLGDDVGLINIITATDTLLRPHSGSVICTESLLGSSEDAKTALSAALGSDIATFSLLVGLLPLGLLSGSTFEDVSNEAALQTLLRGYSCCKQNRLRVHWRFSCPPSSQKTVDRVRVNALDLAGYLFTLCLKGFAQQDVSSLRNRLQRNLPEQESNDMPRYTRAAVAALLRTIKTRVIADWNLLMKLFLQLVENDKTLIVGSKSLLELKMHLASSGVWTDPVLAEKPRKLQEKLNLPLRPLSDDRGVLGEVDLPPVVQMIMSVPRKQLHVITNSNLDIDEAPGIHVSVKQQLGSAPYENDFYSFHCFFGRFVKRDDCSGPAYKEDSRYSSGSADLVIMCTVPTFSLLIGPRHGVKVSLVLNNSPDNVTRFQSRLGPRLILFETSLDDEQRLSICRNALYTTNLYGTVVQRKRLAASTSHCDAEETASAKFEELQKITHLQIRKSFPPGSEESKALASGVTVRAVQMDLWTVILKIGDHFKPALRFPFPVQPQSAKTRVARASSWIEVEAAIYFAPQQDLFDTWTQIRCEPDQSLSLDYIPRVALDIQPLVASITGKDSAWIQMFLMTTLGSTEKHLMDQDAEVSLGPKSNLRKSLYPIFSSSSGFEPKAPGIVRTFQLTPNSTRTCHTLIFVESMRHDLDLGSIVLDAWAVPLTSKLIPELDHAVQGLLATKIERCDLYLSDSDSVLWKRFLPALAERCRTWDHKASCEYRTQGRIPLSVEADQSPLCSCGEGIAASNFARDVPEWRPFAKFVTRIAIAPFFPVPFVDSIAFPGPEIYLKALASQKCEACGSVSDKLKACTGCGEVQYCGKECQKAGWGTHKLRCKSWKPQSEFIILGQKNRLSRTFR